MNKEIENYSAAKKEWNSAILDNTDETWGHYANKSDRERQILHDLTYMWNLTKNLKETE